MIILKYVLLILLCIISIAIVREKNHGRTIVLFSAFSLVAASLYFYHHGPDVALAEIVVGSALIPLIFLISISKQRTFTVINNIGEQFDQMEVLEQFCHDENLKLDIVDNNENESNTLKVMTGIFRRQDIDLIIDINAPKKKFILVGKKTNIMLGRLETRVSDIKNMELRLLSDRETID